MVARFYLIRHAETVDAETRRYKGHIDVPLSENGVEQMKQVSKYMNKFYMSHKTYNAIYCSDLSRAVKSAEIIAEPYGLKPIIMPELRERNFGIWEGMTFDEIKGKYPEEFEAWARNPLKFSPMHGESTIEVRDRVITALDKILNNCLSVGQGSRVKGQESEVKEIRSFEDEKTQKTLPDSISQPLNISSSQIQNSSLGNIVIVAHGGVNRVILCHLLGIPLENIFRIEQDYGCLNIIEFYDGYPVVKLINGRWKMENGI